MYRYELHMHTKEGSACAVSLVEDMIKQYVKIGFSGAVVTNHFIRGNTCVSRSLPWEQLIMQYSKAYTNGRKIAEELDFDLFFGIEEGYGNGKEFLAYGFEPEFLLSRPFLRNADLNIWAQEIHSVGGFIAYAHPFRDRDYITNPDEVPNISIVDGIEGYNRGNRDIENEKAIRVFGNADTIITAGSDLHSTDFDSAYGIETQHRIRSNEELVKTLLERMLMYGREAQRKTRIASPATIPKSGERNRKIYSCMLYLISI